MVQTTVHDDLIPGQEYLIAYHVGGAPDSGTETRELRNVGVFLGFRPNKELEAPRCLCCHWKANMGFYEFLDPRNGGTFRFCTKCISMNVSHTKLKSHIWEDMDDYWAECAEDFKMESLKVLAGTLSDMMDWYKVEPELSQQIKAKFQL